MVITEMLVLAVILVSGVIRGVTGFGGSMLMAPPLSILIGPVPAVATALVLETAAAILMLPETWRHIDGSRLALLAIPACVTVPIGGLLLVTLDVDLARRLISGIVVLFSLAMLAGFRYQGRPRKVTAAALGALAGVLLGATSVGAPPVIFYLLSGPDPQIVTRANLVAFITIISAVGLIVLFGSGAVPFDTARPSAVLILPYLAMIYVGGKLFHRMTDINVRRTALGLMLVTGTIGLLL